MTMDAFNPGGVNDTSSWKTLDQLSGEKVLAIFESYAGRLDHEQCGQREWRMIANDWAWRMPSVDDSLSTHVAAIPEKPWPAPPNPGPTETTEELGMRTAKGGYPEHQPKPLTLSEAILSAPVLPVVKCPHFVDAENAVRSRVYEDVNRERARQDRKFGPQTHHPFAWLAILGEEYGEACQAALHTQFNGKAKGTFRNEVLHTAAVAIAILEDMDRQGIK